MYRNVALTLLISGLLAMILGCSGTSGITEPDPVIDETTSASQNENLRALWGVYDIVLNIETLEASVKPYSRELLTHFNVSGMVLPPKCSDCLIIQVTGFDPVTKIVDVTVTLKNPTAVTGYDVRTVVQDYDAKEFLDTNGYTSIWNLTGVQNPFYSFAESDPTRMFGPSAVHSRNIQIQMGQGATAKATIIVDASWPDNCVEPYEIFTVASSWLINDGADDTKIVAYVSDHQDNVEFVSADLTPLGGVMTPMLDDGTSGDGETGDGIYAVNKISTTVPIGEYQIWVQAISVGSDLLTYQRVKIIVSDVDPYRGDPDYDRIYDTSQVQRIDVTITPENWAALQNDLDTQIPLPWEDRDFSFFECDVEYDGLTWEHVGIRYKGNSSISEPYKQGQEKLPFRMDFDEYEDVYPETAGQRIWGLKKMVFNNGYKDATMLREILTYEMFRDYGAYASRSSHYTLFIDFGNGPVYFGLYTNVEAVDKRFVSDRFDDNDGNLYKPEGDGADLTYFNQDSFVKETNESDADWSDVINFINVLNANYGSDSQFQAAIEQVLDVDSFLDWLVVNSVLVNIDSYAAMTHNYYLYNNPTDGKFYFIPWDCNESFGAFSQGFNVDNIHTWDILNPVSGSGSKPLIENILDNPTYFAEYKLRVKEFLNLYFNESYLYGRIDTLHNIGRPYVIGADGEFSPYTLLYSQGEFDDNITQNVPPNGPQAVPGLKPFITNRRTYINTKIP